MKKLLALLLALAIPVCALAETYGVSVTIDTDELLFDRFLRNTLGGSKEASDPQFDVYVRLAERLLDDLQLKTAFQDDAMALEVRMGGADLLDLTCYEDGDKMVTTSSLLDGWALEEAFSHPGEQAGQILNAWNCSEWTALFETIKQNACNWLNGLMPVVSSGAFVGDAYTGGTECKTWALQDKDVVALIQATLSDEVRAAFARLAQAAGFDGADLLNRLDEANERVAKENVYRYLLREITDQGTSIGYSLTVYSEKAQLATFSLGIKEKELRLVFGLGIQDKNYWCEMTGSARGRDNLTFLSGTCTEWLATKEQSFEYVKAVNAPLSAQTWYCNVTKSGKRYLWNARISEGDKSKTATQYSSTGTFVPETGELDCSIMIGAGSYTPLTLKLECGLVAAIAPLNPTLERCSVNDPTDETRYQELRAWLYSRLLARLIKLIPLDILLQLEIPGMP